MGLDKMSPECYIGYMESSELPFKKGDVIQIPSGLKVKSTNPSKREYLTKRAQSIKVFRVDNGADMEESLYEYEVDRYGANKDAPVVERNIFGELRKRRVISNPSVVFVGSGGYWCSIEIRDILCAAKEMSSGLK